MIQLIVLAIVIRLAYKSVKQKPLTEDEYGYKLNIKD